MEPLITVIVPIYKVQPYLKRCVDSIRMQSYQNLDILLIDDGSPDECPQMCDEFAKEDSRIRVIHQSNKGLAESRNIGISNAKGELISFVDSDDFIHRDMIKTLYGNMKKFNADLSCCGHTNIYPNGYIENASIQKRVKIYTTEEALSKFLFTYEIDVVSWNKLYKKELFDGVVFPKGLLYEDHYAVYKLIDRSQMIVYDTSSLYYYCKRVSSIGGAKFSPTIYQLSSALNAEESFIVGKYPHLAQTIALAKLTWLMTIYNKMIQSDLEDKDFVCKLHKMAGSLLKVILNSREIHELRRFQLLIFYLNKSLYYRLYIRFIRKYRGSNI